jgi:hypothetical protein
MRFLSIKKLIRGTLLVLSFNYTVATAQEATVSSGGDISSGSGSAAFSIGQVVYTTNTGSNGSVAQGVQQPYEISIATGLEATNIQLQIIAFPNPTTTNLQLQIDNFNGDILYELYNNNAQLIDNKTIETNITLIETKHYASGIYYLKVIQQNKEVKTFKIIKN